ncbi:MAG TPA: hypothetical protein VGI75_02825 [Pirellulales bacterium]
MPSDAKPTDVTLCSHCGHEIQKQPLKERTMPDLLIDPERQSFADAEGAFVPPGTAPGPKTTDITRESKPGPELPSAQPKPADDEPWESAPAAQDAAPGSRSAKGGRRKRNPAAELVKMIVGGIVGLAIGYGILLYGFKVDPFQMARYLPAPIVPESLRAP